MPRTPKKLTFQAFNTQENCFSKHQKHLKTLQDWRIQDMPLMIEIGAGSAKISQGFSQAHPNWQVIAIDKKSDRLYKLAKQTVSNNLVFLQTDIRSLSDLIDLRNQVDLLWLAFPDPYPNRRHVKHRLVNPEFLELYAQLLKTQGVLRFKTDHNQLFWYAQATLRDNVNLKINDSITDLWQQNCSRYSEDVKTATDYEARFLKLGLPIHYLEAQKIC